MPSAETQKLADKIARMLEGDPSPPDTAAIFAALEKINHRLDKLEQSSGTNFRSEMSNLRSAHPSLDKFNIAEAIADSIFDGRLKEKACQFEPGKPCDHCSMCNSRGF